jgi:hypothetical protein
LVVILCKLQQSFPYQLLLFQCWGPCGILHWTLHTETAKLVPVKDTLRVRRRDTSSFDSPVVTDLGEGACQKILIHQVFNGSVKVWSRYEWGGMSFWVRRYVKKTYRLTWTIVCDWHYCLYNSLYLFCLCLHCKMHLRRVLNDVSPYNVVKCPKYPRSPVYLQVGTPYPLFIYCESPPVN